MSSRPNGVVARGIGWGRIASAVGLLLLAGTAAAEDPSLIGELIDSLCESGDLTPDRCRELRARAAAEAEAGAEPSAEDPTGWRTTWRNNFRVERNDGLHQLRFGGRIQLDWAALALSPSDEGIRRNHDQAMWALGKSGEPAGVATTALAGGQLKGEAGGRSEGGESFYWIEPR